MSSGIILNSIISFLLKCTIYANPGRFDRDEKTRETTPWTCWGERKYPVLIWVQDYFQTSRQLAMRKVSNLFLFEKTLLLKRWNEGLSR